MRSQYKNQMKSNSRINKQEQVQVVIRLKPENSQNKYQKCAYLASQDSNALVVQTQNKKQFFVFDAIANQDISQFSIYQSIGRQAVTKSLQGYNCCIFAYGQTGSGKTYSILGILQDIVQNIYSQTRGILPRLLQDLFKQVQQLNATSTIRCSYMEIYNQQIFDLLSDNINYLQIRQGMQKGVYVQGLDLQKITNYQQAINLVLRGQKNRKIASTSMNSESSRSHTILTIYVQSQIQQEDVIKVRKSKINIVDLAGSQRVKHTNVQGQRLRQGCNINRSLHVLGNVINALVQSSKKKKHIPFRDSKLTYYLKDSLGGNSITKLLANIQCNRLYLGDTLSTLMFAKRAKILKMKVQVNENATQNYDQLRKQIKKLRQQLAQAKYINQTRLSDRFQTQNDTTQINFQKYDTSNFQYSNTDKPIQVFQENQLHYKALIQIYEEHMNQCQSFNDENLNIKSNSFTKKKNNNILHHSQWKKLEKTNKALISLLKRMPAFTKIYRQNQLLKHQRTIDKREKSIDKHQRNNDKNSLRSITKKSISHQTNFNSFTSNQSTNIRDYSYAQQKIPLHSTTLQLQDSQQFDILHQSFIPSQLQQEMIQKAVQRTVQQYQNIITEMAQKFDLCLNQLDRSYFDLQKQIQQKDKKIRDISKRQLPTNLQDLIDENEYLKLNILELEAQINDLYRDIELTRIKQKEQGRRYSLFQQPLSNKKINNDQQQNSMSQSLKFDDLMKLKMQDQLNKQSNKTIQSNPELQLNKQILQSIQNLRLSAIKQAQQYNKQRQTMIDCIQRLQNQCKNLITQNKQMILKNEQLKLDKNYLIEQILKVSPQKYQENASFNKENIKNFELLWVQFNQQKVLQQQFNQYKSKTQQQTDILYVKLQQMEKVKNQLNQFILKEKSTQKQFGKSINQILDQYAEILQNKSIQQSITLSSKPGSHGSTKGLLHARSSKFVNLNKGNNIKSTKQFGSTHRISNIESQSNNRQGQRGNSKSSSRASHEKIFSYRSPKK